MTVIFMRDKHMSAQDLDDDHILLLASLNDTDQIMQLRCVISFPGMKIKEASVKFLRSPGPECLTATVNAEKLIGLVIEPGYNKKVKQALGGMSGCVHMVDLAIEVGHTAVQAKLKRMEGSTKGLNTDDKKQFWRGELQGQCVRYR